MCGSDGLSSSSSLLICGKSCRCQAENPLNALPSFTRPALKLNERSRTGRSPHLWPKCDMLGMFEPGACYKDGTAVLRMVGGTIRCECGGTRQKLGRQNLSCKQTPTRGRKVK